jgi:hypothetical protein
MPEISVDDSERNQSVFEGLFWQRVGQKVLLLRRYTREVEFFFTFEDISRNVNEGRGLGIAGFQFPYLDHMLEEIENEGLIQIIRERRGFRLTRNGLQYCEQLPVTYG